MSKTQRGPNDKAVVQAIREYADGWMRQLVINPPKPEPIPAPQPETESADEPEEIETNV